jgi:hypothetical protein
VLWTLDRIKVAVENKRVQVEPVWPHDRSVIYGDLGEIAGILKGFEHRTPKVTSKIDRAFDAVIKDEPESVRRHNRH